MAAQAAAGYTTSSTGSKASKSRKQANDALTEAAVQQLKSMLHVRGIGKGYERLLRDKGIQTVEQLSGGIISTLEKTATDGITWSPAVKYLQVNSSSLGFCDKSSASRGILYPSNHDRACVAAALHILPQVHCRMSCKHGLRWQSSWNYCASVRIGLHSTGCINSCNLPALHMRLSVPMQTS